MRPNGQVHDDALLLRDSFGAAKIVDQLIAKFVQRMRDAASSVDHVITESRQRAFRGPVPGLCSRKSWLFAPLHGRFHVFASVLGVTLLSTGERELEGKRRSIKHLEAVRIGLQSRLKRTMRAAWALFRLVSRCSHGRVETRCRRAVALRS